MQLLEQMIYQYLMEESQRKQNRIVDLERAYWWYGFDSFATFEVLEAKIQQETFCQIADDLYKLLRLFGSG